MGRRFLFFILLLQGCVKIPEHDFATVATQSGLERDREHAAEAGFASGEWPNREWWKEYDDCVLNGLIETAISCNPTLKLAEERLKSAAQVTIEKRAVLFPELDFDGNDNYEHFSRYGFFRTIAPTVPAVVNDITLNLTYRWEIDFWGKNRDILSAAIGEVNARAAEVDGAKLMLTTSIVYNYIELQFLLRWKELLEAKDTNNQSIVKIRSRREKYALDTALLVLGAELEKLDTEAELTNVDILIQTHLHELKALSGMGQDMCLEIPFHEMNASVATLPCNLSLDLLARRPDLAAQKARVEAAAKLVDAAKTDFYPSVNLLGYAGLESLNWSTIFQPPSFNGSLQPAVHLPIFTAGRIRAQMMEKIAEFNQAVEGYNALILKAAKEVADELTTILRIEKEICVRAASYETTAKQEALTNRRVKHALDDQLSLLQIQNKSLDIQVILTTLQYGKQLANVLLIRSLGGGTHE